MVTYSGVAVASHLIIRLVLQPQLEAARAELSVLEPKILADLKLLNDEPLFPNSAREKNAEHFLSGFIAWSGHMAKPLSTVEHQRLVELMSSHKQALTDTEHWAKFRADPNLKALDLSWVDQLVAYDHINLESQVDQSWVLEQVEKSNGVERIGIAERLPMPELQELQFAALARAAQLHNEKRVNEALPLHRHVSQLLASTDCLVGSALAASMLKNETVLADRVGAKWTPMDLNKLAAFKRASWAWIGIQSLRATHEIGAFGPYLNRKTSACTGAFELLGTTSQLRDFFVPTAFLETDFSEKFALADKFRGHVLDECGHESLKVFLKPVPKEANPLFVGRHRANIERIPFVRRLYGLQLILIASPNFFRLYEERQPASNPPQVDESL